MEPLVISLIETAKALKLDVVETTRRLNNGEIPAYRDGRNWKIPKTLLRTYAENKAISEAKERKRIHEDLKKGG